MTTEIAPYRVYTPSEAAELLQLPVEVVLVAIKSGELAARQAGGESRILGQGLINYLLGGRGGQPSPSDLEASPSERRRAIRRGAAGGPGNTYNVTAARGGMDDQSIEAEMKVKLDALRRGEQIDLTPHTLRRSHWNGRDEVDIQNDCVVFSDRKDHTMVPVAIKAATRVLHRFGVRGRFKISAWDEVLTIEPVPL